VPTLRDHPPRNRVRHPLDGAAVILDGFFCRFDRALPAVSESDIASASAVVRAHVEAFARGDASAWRATLGRYKAGGWDATQFERTVVAWRDVRLESLELSGLYTTDSPPSSYVSNYGAPPFATIVLHARFERPDNAPEMAPYDWDYILVRETPDGPWRIHDWGG
jgi:hypothetical protein